MSKDGANRRHWDHKLTQAFVTSAIQAPETAHKCKMFKEICKQRQFKGRSQDLAPWIDVKLCFFPLLDEMSLC